MSRPFDHDAANLHDFFSQGGRGFYIPYYQRPYSWDEENATKLVDDILSSITRTITKPDNSIFLGTVILHDERNIQPNVHVDTQNLLTKVANVVDGQQRISSIAMLACAIDSKIDQTVDKLNALAGANQEFRSLATELIDEKHNIRPFFSVEITKTGAQPKLKPKIIRAGEVSTNPVSDQWTLNGDINTYYKSNTSRFLSKYIAGESLNQIDTDGRVGTVIKVFDDKLTDRIAASDSQIMFDLLAANNTSGGSLANFMASPPDPTYFGSLTQDEQVLYSGGMLLLAVCNFLRNSCYLVVIECLDEGLAFDMFQSLNATGTPLTAFEVFKPQVVKAWNSAYAAQAKPRVDRIEKIIDEETNASEKENVTDKIIVSTALVFDGTELSRLFSDERDWLTKTLNNSLGAGDVPTNQSVDLLTCLGDQANYYKHFIKPRRSPKDSRSFGLCQHLQGLGLNSTQADLAALCVIYLKDAGHRFAHSVLSVFYSKLLRAQSDPALKTSAAIEFEEVCKATAAFFTFFMGAQSSRFPDTTYRNLFQSAAGNISLLNGSSNQTSAFIKAAYREALEELNIYHASDRNIARQSWVASAREKQWYSRKSVSRFALLASAHDAAPDVSPGNEGLFTNGMPHSAELLNCRVWHSSEYEVIEHIATRDQPSTIKYSSHFDQTVYPGNFSIVDKLGNLTLLSTPVNSSIYSEWPDKVFYYWNLTTPSQTASGPTGVGLATSLAIGRVPPALSSLSAASSYLSHLAPLAYRGVQGKKWDAAFIASRSEHLCQRAFDKLDPWLR